MTTYANDERMLATDDFLTPTLGESPASTSYFVHSVSTNASISRWMYFLGYPQGENEPLPHSAAEETAGILASPDLVQAIAEGLEDFRRGDVLGSEELDELLARRRER